ncbi:hypothetical protein R3P38DRAFT_2986375 [Favolaschia claudopus]|uniref:Secreted protein n=1 Tax=Favolaschia claudopus TaxID=2862362 RepID=A0AAW0AX54_9AGAR
MTCPRLFVIFLISVGQARPGRRNTCLCVRTHCFLPLDLLRARTGRCSSIFLFSRYLTAPHLTDIPSSQTSLFRLPRERGFRSRQGAQ